MEIARIGLIGITLVGMAICTAGIGKVAASGLWLSPAGILGSLLGLVVLAVVAALLLGMPLPAISSDVAAIGLVLAVIVAKMAVAAIFRVA